MTTKSHAPSKNIAVKPSFFSKVFRWQQETPGPMPVRVEIAGSFNGWQKTPMKYDRQRHLAAYAGKYPGQLHA